MIRVLLALVFCVASIGIILLEQFTLALFTSVIAYTIVLYHTYKTAGINSVLFLFIVLFGLYGYSVSISVYFDADIGWHRVAKLRSWEKADFTLFSYMLSNQIALLAIIMVYIPFVKKSTMQMRIVKSSFSKKAYFLIAIIAGVLSSLSEGLNFVRAGGFSSLLKGKAFYQGAVNDLVLNIPYEGFFFISVALFSQFFASSKDRSKYVVFLPLYLISISIVLFVNIAIGERGTLVVALVIAALGYTINRRITHIRFRYIVGIALLYVVFNVFTLLREKTVAYEGFSSFIEEYDQRLIKLMNPANNEFGSPALNYRIFFKRKPADYDFKWGSTYTEIFWAFIPTYVYSSKPKGIIYEFRDRYFSERREMGSTAGTGFSSLMEAYMNFGYFGPYLIYALSVFFLVYMESKKGRNNMFISLYYLLLFNIYLIFSRSASQYILFNAILYLVQISLVVAVYYILPKRNVIDLKFADETT